MCRELHERFIQHSAVAIKKKMSRSIKFFLNRLSTGLSTDCGFL